MKAEFGTQNQQVTLLYVIAYMLHEDESLAHLYDHTAMRNASML